MNRLVDHTVHPPDVARGFFTPLADLVPARRATTALRRHGIVTIADYLAAGTDGLSGLDGVGPRTVALVDRAIAEQFRVLCSPPTDPPMEDWIDELRNHLTGPALALLDAVVGRQRRATDVATAAIALRLDPETVEEAAIAIRTALAKVAPSGQREFEADIDAEIRRQDGIIALVRIDPRSRLGTRLRQPGVRSWLLRLAAVMAPGQRTIECQRLLGIGYVRYRKLRDAVARDLTAGRSNQSLPAIRARLGLAADEDGILLHVLERHARLRLRFTGERGEILVRCHRNRRARLEQIIEEAGRPLSLPDLAFAYQDRFGGCCRKKLRDCLYRSGTFLQLAPDVFDLRTHHLDSLELLRPFAERLSAAVARRGGRIEVDALVAAGRIGPRSGAILRELLRRQSALRDLGRGRFVARHADGSRIVRNIVRELRRAMGEVVFSRFLQNHKESRRRLVSTLLRSNRLFVAPAQDRVDLLENWPFDASRLQLLERTIALALEERGGHAPLEKLLEVLVEAGFREQFLSPTLLVDLLRRHTRFELLAGHRIALPDLHLRERIRREVRALLRTAPEGLSIAQMLDRRPHLAEVGEALEEAVTKDPLLTTEDGLRYRRA
jgi:hypothetical protein